MPRRSYPSDLTEAQWRVLEPLLPAAKPGGRPRSVALREVVDAILYVSRNGATWRALPHDFPPWRTVYHYFRAWARDGTLARLHNGLRERVRQADGRRRTPSAAIVDSQSVRGAETVARAGRGYDAATKVNGRKRHIAVDTTGLLLVVLVTAAGVQDRDAARLLLAGLRTCFPTVTWVWADGGYAGRLVDWAAATLRLSIDIVRKLAGQTTFQPLPRRWVVERTFAWITRCRRTVRDYERRPEHHAAMVQWAMVTVMTRRLARRQRSIRTREAA